MSRSELRPEISVVTPTHNRPASLLRLLHALRDGSFPAERFEVVVVADGCTDDTVAVVRAEPLPFAIRVLEQTPGRGAAAARNLGASIASGSLLVFLDDDIEPGPALLTEHRRAHAEVSVPAVAIGPPLPVRPPEADLGTIAAWFWWEGQFARMRQPGHRFSYDEVFSGNFSMPAALFKAVGGFDVEFNNCRDDSELGLRLINAGARVLYVPAAGGWHHELRDHPRLIRRKHAEGMADVRLARLHPELWSGLRISWPQMPLWHPLGLLRRAALTTPVLAGLLIWSLTRILPILERLRLRGTWRKVQAGVMYGWYWRGIADAVGGRHGLVALGVECKVRTPPPETPLSIDLAHGLEEAERQVESAKPAAVRVHFGELEMGLIPPRPGAEPLRAEHFRAALRTELPHALIAVMSTVAAAGHPAVPHPGALRPTPDPTGPVPPPAVSVVIAAHNAADTLAETLGSLQRQTHLAWEAIVVDDGSTDDTGGIAGRFAAGDPRIRLLRQEQQGSGSARNAGIGAARHPWLLFLDADDWLLPHALERLSEATVALGAVEAVHGGWARVTSDGIVMETEFCPPDDDLFPRFAQRCAFPIHVCLFRRELAARVGGFDPALRTCQDWDFWQRIARSGARFGRINEKVAHYRMRLGSSATATDHLLPNGFAVIGRGHQRDPRVQSSKHPEGVPCTALPTARLQFASWVAGLLIGRGSPVAVVLESLKGDSAPGLDPLGITSYLFHSVPLSLARGADAWDELWPRVAGNVESFLDALERQSGSWRLARRTMLALERLTLDVSRTSRPFIRGTTQAVVVEVTEPIEAIRASAAVQRIHCAVLVNGERIGAVLLPVFDGLLPARVLTDAIAAAFAWPILGRFFGATRYANLELARSPAGVSVCLAGVPLAPPAPDAVVVARDGLHDLIGWTVFLQEVWGAPRLSLEDFFREGGREDQEAVESDITAWPVVEISAELPRLRITEPRAFVEVRVGGVPIGLLPVAGDDGAITPSRLRSAITTETGMELCRVVVREAILGQSFQGGGLRVRLAAAAERSRAAPATEVRIESIPASAEDRFAPDWRGVVRGVAGSATTAVVLARHAPGVLNDPADRRASLPFAAAPALLEAAALSGAPAVRFTESGHVPARVEYLPELLWRPDAEFAHHVRDAEPEPAGAPGTSQSAGSDTTLPILLYHSIASNGPVGTANHQVRPELFEAQLRYLSEAGFSTVTIAQWLAASRAHRPLSRRSVVLTFDTGYRDFADTAWPLLKRQGFGALVFLAADLVGGSNHWDAAVGDSVPLLDWDRIRRLVFEGVEFGAHSASHRPMTGLSPTEIALEAIRTRLVLERGLGRPIPTFAYPHGDTDPVVQHLIGACGFQAGFTCRTARAAFQDPVLALPRIEISGEDDLSAFIAKLGG